MPKIMNLLVNLIFLLFTSYPAKCVRILSTAQHAKKVHTKLPSVSFRKKDHSPKLANSPNNSSIARRSKKPKKEAEDVVNVKAFGAIGDYNPSIGTGTDNSVPIQNAIDFAQKTRSKKVLIPKGYYLTRRCIIHRSGITVLGESKSQTIIINKATTGPLGPATTWMFGTYGPGNASIGTPKNEVGYDFNEVKAGSTIVRLSVANEATNFNAGDLISVEGGTAKLKTLNTPNEMAVVVDADSKTGRIILDKPLLSDYSNETAQIKIRKLNTGKPASTSITGVWPGTTAYVLTDARLSNLTLISTLDGYAPINLSCFNSQIDNLITRGHYVMAGNPVARTQIRNIEGYFNNTIMDLAYLTHNTVISNSKFVRARNSVNPSNMAGLWINSSEGAKYVDLIDINIVETDSTSLSSSAVVDLNGDGCRIIGGSISSTRKAITVNVGGRGSSVDGLKIYKSGKHGIVVNGTDGFVRNCVILNTPPGQKAIIIGPSASNFEIEKNTMGQGPRSTADIIADLSSSRNNKKINNTSYSPN